MLKVVSRTKTILKRVIASSLLLVLIVNLAVQLVPMVKADAYSQIGNNLALGSPVLNSAAVTDDWNPDESLVWGIYLSNFCIPFVDNYESAFNLSSESGSQGRGTKSLSFGSGSDIQNSSTIQDLTSFAIDMQSVSTKRISVSYNEFQVNPSSGEREYTVVNGFDQDGTETRGATLADLFLRLYEKQATKDDAGLYPNTIDQAIEGWICATGELYNYAWDDGTTDGLNIKDARSGKIPTFAVDSDDGPEIVLDYRESYDYEMLIGALCSAFSSDYADIAAEMFQSIDVMNSIPLYTDSYGNITGQYNGKFIVIIPASANQYITEERSINLLNSLIFNASTNSGNTETIKMYGGVSVDDRNTGGLAFTNGATKLKNAGMVLFFDSDSWKFDPDNLKYTVIDGATIAQITGGNDKVYEFNTPGALKALFDAEITENGATLPLKIEPLNMSLDLFDKLPKSTTDDEDNEVEYTADNVEKSDTTVPYFLVLDTITGTSYLSNFVNNTANTPMLHELKVTSSSEPIKLFEETFVMPTNCKVAINSNGSKNQNAVFRNVTGYMYDLYTATETDDNREAKSQVNTVLNLGQGYHPKLLMKNLVFSDPDSAKYLSSFSESFMSNFSADKSIYKFPSGFDYSQITRGRWGNSGGSGADMLALADSSSTFDKYRQFTWEENFISWDDETDRKYCENIFARNVKIFKTSSQLEQVANILGIVDGTDFAAYADDIYLTYLDWYGLKNNALTGEWSSDLNYNIVNGELAIQDIGSVTSMKSEDDLEREVLNYTYYMLSPEDGKDYRSQIMISNMASWIWEQYQKVVYGGSDTYYYSTVSTRSNTGFLTVQNYSENFMTGWLMKSYPVYAIFIIAIGVILVIVMGLLKSRKISWFLLGVIAVILVTIILPSSGEIVPAVSNRVVQNIFNNNMTYWSISEQCANASVELQIVNDDDYSSDFTTTEKQQIAALVNDKKSLYLDRYISIKQDIANKVTSVMNADYDEIQTLKSTRWLLPTILRQWTASDGSADYVYVSLGDKLEDCSNMLYYYKPSESAGVVSVNTVDVENGVTSPTEYGDTTGNSGRFDSASFDLLDGQAGMYWSSFDTISSEGTDKQDYRSNSYAVSSDGVTSEMPLHTYSYILEAGKISFSMPDPTKVSNFAEWAQTLSDNLQTNQTNRRSIERINDELQKVASAYERYDRSTIHQSFAYLWATESPLQYFYQNAHDTFIEGATLARVVSDIQGEVVQDNGKEFTGSPDQGEGYRKSIMHYFSPAASDTADPISGVKDILDLENLFRNTVPYLYSMQLLAGGYDQESGVFGNELLKNYPAYEDNKNSWLYRSNWVTKLLENPDYNKPDIATAADGTKVTINIPILPTSYPDNRPMVFSEAQMAIQGLKEDDLTLVELKCVEANKQAAESWTLLLNYVGTTGITKEVLLRQMAVDSTLAFDSVFSPSGISTQALELCPNTLDLRSISFDSVMKMLMLNVSKDTSYIYGDSMRTVIEDSDMFTAGFLLVLAYLCVYIIPFVRNLTLGLIFYLGFIAVLRCLFRPAKQKVKTTAGYMACNIGYMIINIAYLMGFNVLMQVTTDEDVLSVSNNSISVGNPVWLFVVILILNILFLIFSYLMCKFCLKNYRDMGYSAIHEAINLAGVSLSSGVEKLMQKMDEAAGGESSSKASRGRRSGSGGSTSQDESSSEGSEGSGTGDKPNSKGKKKNSSSDEDEDYSYQQGEGKESNSSSDDDSADIDRTIERGREKSNNPQGNTGEKSSTNTNNSQGNRSSSGNTSSSGNDGASRAQGASHTQGKTRGNSTSKNQKHVYNQSDRPTGKEKKSEE